MTILVLFAGFVLIIAVVITVYNFFTVPQILNIFKSNSGDKLFSILIPARNEENNIIECLNSVINQTYKKIEVIVLDDNSEDETGKLIREFSGSHQNIKLISGEALPGGWNGKNWACHQLSRNASGEYLLFIDADITLAENAVSNALSLFNKNNLDMLSCFSTQKIKSPGEFFIVPLMNWLLLTFLPLYQVYLSGRKELAAANGQFMLFERQSYFLTGGHEAVKNKIVEDMELAKIIKIKNMRLMTALGGDAVFCRMYKGFLPAVRGFSKNFFPGFNFNLISFSGFLLLVFVVFTLPVVLGIGDFNYIWLVFLILFNRYFVALMSRQNIFLNVLLHPFQMVVLMFTGILSVFLSLTGKLSWKGRSIVRK